MSRERRVTQAKLDRAQSAVEDLLACTDVEFRMIFRHTLRALRALRQWCSDDAAEPGVLLDLRSETAELDAETQP